MSSFAQHPPSWIMTRGIMNISGVSCHLTAAIQIIFHSLPQLKTCLMALAELEEVVVVTSAELKFLTRLGRLFCDLNDESDSTTAVDPTQLYKALDLVSSSAIDPHELGDAVSALRILLETIHDCVMKEVDRQKSIDWLQRLNDVMEKCVFGGKLNQTLVGRRGNNVRTRTKVRAMTCPFVIGTNGTSSIPEALFQSTMEPQVIEGDYDWENATNYVETRTKQGEQEEYAEHQTSWTTHKTTPILTLPQHLFLHLQQRFSYDNNSVQVFSSPIDVPASLSMMDYMSESFPSDTDCRYSSCCFQYQLVGAILHVSDSNNNESEDEEGGHYIALVRDNKSQTNNEAWLLLDDEHVKPMQGEEEVLIHVLDLLSCRPYKLDMKSDHVATLLVYSRICCCNDVNEDIIAEFTNSVQEFTKNSLQADEARMQSMVGKRLRVRWSKGKFYAGTIRSYNAETKKHCVEYDDGDVRHYILRKKNIEWI